MPLVSNLIVTNSVQMLKEREDARLYLNKVKGRARYNALKAQSRGLNYTASHHWLGDPTPSQYCGFVYLITNLISGKKYVGGKQYLFNNWQWYCGSSKELHQDMSDLGLRNFRFEILSQWFTKEQLGEAEKAEQRNREVVDGNYYNKVIMGIPLNKYDRLAKEQSK